MELSVPRPIPDSLIRPGETVNLVSPKIKIVIRWEDYGPDLCDLDMCCVALNHRGKVLDTVYSAKLSGMDGKLLHSGLAHRPQPSVAVDPSLPPLPLATFDFSIPSGTPINITLSPLPPPSPPAAVTMAPPPLPLAVITPPPDDSPAQQPMALAPVRALSSDRQHITAELTTLPQEVAALCFLVTSASGQRFFHFETAEVRVLDAENQCIGKCLVGAAGNASAMLIGSVVRDLEFDLWRLVAHQASCQGRTFADALPMVQELLAAIIPTVEIERRTDVPILRRGEQFLLDPRYTQGRLTVSVRWAADGDPLDVDLSCIPLNAAWQAVKDEVVFFSRLANSNGSIRHSGDQQSGRGEGDDERLTMALPQVPPDITGLGIALNVYTEGQNFGRCKSSHCRLLDAEGHELVRYSLAEHSEANCVAMALLFRLGPAAPWSIVALGMPTQGTLAMDAAPVFERLMMHLVEEDGRRALRVQTLPGGAPPPLDPALPTALPASGVPASGVPIQQPMVARPPGPPPQRPPPPARPHRVRAPPRLCPHRPSAASSSNWRVAPRSAPFPLLPSPPLPPP
ncbi:putative stress protein [Paratrimastix pyriformis]|uniref:Stress protein n=1 Tax=Paratrimastix pyriformis TaxID=342808 RepID=A0ABQ8UZP3_9EUKA|nr:putative stress protein [Paratrimastix pyriformis]